MSRHAVVKRAKIARCRNPLGLWSKKTKEEIIQDIIQCYKISVQPVSEMTEEQRSQRWAPRIDIEISR
jgi:hypothetical protein